MTTSPRNFRIAFIVIILFPNELYSRFYEFPYLVRLADVSSAVRSYGLFVFSQESNERLYTILLPFIFKRKFFLLTKSAERIKTNLQPQTMPELNGKDVERNFHLV
jgi:hypothetical protein